MPSAPPPASPSPPSAESSAATKSPKFREMLGFGSASPSGDSPSPSAASPLRKSASFHKKKAGSARRLANASAAVDDTFFEVPDPKLAGDRTGDSGAKDPGARRGPLRMDAQDGPWSVSVADHPHVANSYTLYIKTPTHNLTLTRSAREIVELHNKLRDTHPSATLPRLPIDAGAMQAPPPKRKSAFLSTLSRLASPASSKTSKHGGRSTSTPAAQSPAAEIKDPFTTGAPSANGAKVGGAALAAYLTTLAHDQLLHQSRPWRRFVRVRTDDLESVRVERAIKRVRSDLASHASPKTAEYPKAMRAVNETLPDEDDVAKLGWRDEDDAVDSPAGAESAAPSIKVPSVNQESERETAEVPPVPRKSAERPSAEPEGVVDENERPSSRASTRTSRAPTKPTPVNGVKPVTTEVASALEGFADDDLAGPATPTAEMIAPRIPRSLSADPAKSGSRLSKAYSSNAETTDTATDTAESEAPSETGDEASSMSTSTADARAARRKRKTDARAPKKSTRKVVLDDFEMMRVLGKGCAGKVLLVRHKSSTDLYALKAITKRHVLAHQELQHTLTEQAVLKRMAAEASDPFVVRLWWSFHDKENLFLVMDFHPGGDLATQLARWGRLGRDRARFYAAEIVEGVEGLHAAGVIYRDLKPENVLIGGDGHIVLTDFGLSKEFPRRTNALTAPPTPSGTRELPSVPPWMRTGGDLNGWPGQPIGHTDNTTTFCGTAEYLAPEVIQGLSYSYEVDWWSFGTMLYEMLTGITPFWANNHADMYVRVLQDELQFPDDRTMDQDTKSILRGLLQRNPSLRLSEPRIKKHPYFSMIDWTHVYYKRYIPPYIPPIDPSNAGDTQNFDETFLDMQPVINDPNDQDETDQGEHTETDTDRTDGESGPTPSQSRSPSVHPDDDSVDVFDGYSFKGRHSVLIDDDDSSGTGEDTEEDESSASADVSAATPVVAHDAHAAADEPASVEEPTTPEARSAALVEAETVDAMPTAPEASGVAPNKPITEPLVIEEEAAVSQAKKPEVPSKSPVDEKVPKSSVSENKPKSPINEKAPKSPINEKASKSPVEDKAPVKVKTEAKSSKSPVHSKSQSAEIKASTSEKVLDDSKEHTAEEKKELLDMVPPMASKVASRPPHGRPARNRREKSGIPALDKHLPSEDEGITEFEDDDWDFVEAGPMEEHNGAKATSLFARGVVDRYKLSVFRKGSTPGRQSQRTASGMSVGSEATSPTGLDSPSPSVKQRRGRNPGLTFRRHPKEFLRTKSPASSKSRATAQTLQPSASSTLSAGSTPGMSPSPSMGSSTMPASSPSLRTKESNISVATTPSMASDRSDQSSPEVHNDSTIRSRPSVENTPQKNKKVLKKYKEGAEKVLALFSARQP